MEEQKMPSKEEIIERLEHALKELSIEDLMKSWKEISVQFEQASEVEKEAAREAYNANEENEEPFVFQPGPLDEKFSELVAIYKEKKKAHKAAMAKQMEENYLQKRAIIEKLETLTGEEITNIGAAFKTFYELRDQWNEIGDVNQARYKQLQFDYSHLVDLFYYHIGVHKELQNYDFKKNATAKEAVIQKIQSLKENDSIRQLEHFIKEYQNEWDAIGPTTQEKWEELKEQYWNQVNEIYEKIKLHYQNIRERQKERLEAKEQLLSKAKETLSSITEDLKVRDWQNLTNKMQAFQDEWKQVGYTKKSAEDDLWETFRATMNDFFEQKSNFFEGLKKEQGKHEKRKRALIEKAEALKDSKEWQATSKQLIQLQQDWKKSGRVAPHLDQKLWKQFRAACDTFFTAKKEFYDGMEDRQAENLKQKAAAIKSIEEAKDKNALLQAVSDWHKIGFVPKEEVKKVQNAFDMSINEMAKKLKLDNIEELIFEAKVSALKAGEDAKRLLADERKFIKAKMDKLKDELMQYENNLSFFGPSKGAQKLKEVVSAKMETVTAQMEDLKKKMNMLQ